MREIVLLALLGMAGGDLRDALADFRDQPALALGQSVRSLVARLGEPENAAFSFVDNPHVVNMKDARIALRWEGIEATVLVGLCCDKSLLERVHVTSSAGAQALEIPWPMRAADVRRRFGSPRDETANELVYVLETEVGADTIVFHMTSGAVRSVEWRYFID